MELLRRSMNLLIPVYVLIKMKIILCIRCYRSDPIPAGQKSPDPTESGTSPLEKTGIFFLFDLTKGGNDFFSLELLWI